MSSPSRIVQIHSMVKTEDLPYLHGGHALSKFVKSLVASNLFRLVCSIPLCTQSAMITLCSAICYVLD